LLSGMLGTSALAQEQNPPEAAPASPAPAQEQAPGPGARSHHTPPVAVAPLDRQWVPDGITALGQFATAHTEFTLDHSMLVMASKVDRDNEDLRRVIAGVNSVSVHSFRYAGEVTFDPAAMDMVIVQYRDAGWQHLVSQHRNERGGQTDLWIRMEGTAIRDIAVLLIRARQMHFVSVSGSITPLDLLRLSGHFGIPRMDDGVVVPVPAPGR